MNQDKIAAIAAAVGKIPYPLDEPIHVTQETLMDTLKALLYVKSKASEGGPDQPYCGICGNMQNAFTGLKVYLRAEHIFKSISSMWPKYSGHHLYPIPGFDGMSADKSYIHSIENEMWDPEHPYGALRHELLEFAIKTLEEALQE